MLLTEVLKMLSTRAGLSDEVGEACVKSLGKSENFHHIYYTFFYTTLEGHTPSPSQEGSSVQNPPIEEIKVKSPLLRANLYTQK